MKIPETLDELKNLTYLQIEELNKHYHIKGTTNYTTQNNYRLLWYKIQCEKFNQKLKIKHKNRLDRYATDPEHYISTSRQTKYSIKTGTQIEKIYKGKQYIITALGNDRYLYNGKEYASISGIAREICGHNVSGYRFFGFKG